MEPLFKDKGFVFIRKYLLHSPQTGDVIVLKCPRFKIPLLKRVMKINRDLVWVEGDNKKGSYDSRTFGWVSRKDIQGKVLGQVSR